MPAARSTPFWMPARFAARRPALAVRTRLKSAIRAHFERQDFWEVETNVAQFSPGNETHLHAFETRWTAFGEEQRRAYLHTSPEFAMKKLLAAGEKRIFQFAPVFRAREQSPLHSAEFTMLEWYRAEEDYSALMADCAALLRLAAEAGGRTIAAHRGRHCDLAAAPERLSVAEAFQRHTGIDLVAAIDEANWGEEDADTGEILVSTRHFAAEAMRIGVRVGEGEGFSDIFSRILSEKIEPHLGIGRPTMLDRYPLSEAALARACPGNGRFAERFELYVCGIELANAFGELTDAGVQRERFEVDMAAKEAIYGERYPLDEDFLDALGYMPPASGAALGYDRLVMLVAGADNVAEVRFEPWGLG